MPLKPTLRKRLDLLPLCILFVCAIWLLIARFSGEILLQYRHLAALILLPLVALLFPIRHKLGVLGTGLLMLLGLFGAISYSPAIHTFRFGTRAGGEETTLLAFQPIFLLWLVIHFILSGRYYTGILTESYWKNLSIDEPMRIGEGS